MNNEIYWQAVKQNDKRFDGLFWTCVRTTKIFCKPSCTARLPKRQNVYFVDTVEKAETDGFRACLRCKPKIEKVVDSKVQTVLNACELLESEENLTLEDLSKKLDVSQYHLQRTFKEIIGVSPKKYAENRRTERFKNEIKDGRNITDAIYEAGFGSSSRLYENAEANLGMTPKTYQKKGKGMKINWTITDCELGRLLVARTEKGICGVKFGDKDGELLNDLKSEYSEAEISQNDEKLQVFVESILLHIAGNNTDLDLPIDVQATAFQMQVWEALRKIPYGETLSYSEVAEKIGKKNAVRAVASACAKNRVALVIPCHRVIGKNGKMSGYRWGIERKKQLLAKEQEL